MSNENVPKQEATEETDSQSSPQGISTEHPQKAAPYEAALLKAFDKLSSQVLIFLLGYVILLIGLAVFGSNLADSLRNLLYIIPVLGVGAYLWSQQRQIAKNAADAGIDVKAGIVTGGARVTGVRSSAGTAPLPQDVDVGVGVATGKATVEGVVIGDEESGTPQPSDEGYLLNLFRKLDDSNRRKVISRADRLLSQQNSANG